MKAFEWTMVVSRLLVLGSCLIFLSEKALADPVEAGILAMRQGRYAEAIDSAFVALTNNTEGDVRKDIKALLTVACSYDKLGLSEQAMAVLVEAEKMVEKWDGDKRGEAAYHNMRANLYLIKASCLINLKQLATADSVISAGLLIVSSSRIHKMLRATKGLIRESQKHYAEAESIYCLMLAEGETEEDRLGAIVNMGRLYLEMNNPIKAKRLLNEYGIDLQHFKGTKVEEEIAILNSNIESSLGNYKDALLWLQRANSLKDSIEQANNNLHLNTWTTRLKLWKTEQERNRAVRDRRIHGMVGLMVILVCMGVIIISAVHIRKRKFQERDLLRTIGEIETSYDREILRLSSTINTQQHRLSELTLQKARFDEAIGQIKDRLSLSSTSTEESYGVKEDIKRLVSDVDNDKKVWESFFEYFNQANYGFLIRLSSLHPSLSRSELRMCAFMVMGLSTKEISSLLSRSEKTVSSTKYHLRKKLGIEVPTEVYLREILAEGSSERMNKSQASGIS